MIFLWDPDQYCEETLYFCVFFSEGGGGGGGGWIGQDPLSTYPVKKKNVLKMFSAL